MKEKLLFITALLLGCALFFGALTWLNGQIVQRVAGGDYFYASWQTARSFMSDGESPYSEATRQNIQPDLNRRDTWHGGEYSFAQPFYKLIPYLPFALLDDFDFARSLWMTFAELALFGFGFLSIYVSNWKPHLLVALLFFVAIVLSFYGLAPLLSGASSIFTAFFLLSMLFALREGWDESLGLLLPLGTFFLAQGGILFLLILFWVLIKGRQRVWLIAAMTLATLYILSFLVLPNWFLPFYENFFASLQNPQGLLFGDLLESWLPDYANLAAQGIRWTVLSILVLNWFNLRKGDFDRLIWTASLSLALLPFLNIPLNPIFFTLYLFPLPFIFKSITDRWGRFMAWLIALFLALLAGSWFYPPLAENPSFFAFFYPALLALGLYWVHWWSLRAPHTWWDKVQTFQR